MDVPCLCPAWCRAFLELLGNTLERKSKGVGYDS
jgi:hypothetical protein